MKIYYATDADSEGRHRIFFAVLDRDTVLFEHSANVPLSTKTIDEIADNAALINDLRRTRGKVDVEGEHKYYVDAAGDIIEKDGWEEYYDGI